jgi:hypothetical protein
VCPFLEKSEPRCTPHLSFRNLTQAYTHCAGCYADCSVYHSLQNATPSKSDIRNNALAFLPAG